MPSPITQPALPVSHPSGQPRLGLFHLALAHPSPPPQLSLSHDCGICIASAWKPRSVSCPVSLSLSLRVSFSSPLSTQNNTPFCHAAQAPPKMPLQTPTPIPIMSIHHCACAAALLAIPAASLVFPFGPLSRPHPITRLHPLPLSFPILGSHLLSCACTCDFLSLDAGSLTHALENAALVVQAQWRI